MVIVILGVLSAAAVFAVRGITDRGQSNSCATDRRTLEQAEDTHYALNGDYVAETDLVSAGVLSDVSTMHDVTLVVDGYSIVPIGICAASGPAPAPPGNGGPVATTWNGLPAQRLGTGATTILLASVGNGLVGAESVWNLAMAGQVPADLSLYFVDTAAFGTSPLSQQLLQLFVPQTDLVLWFSSNSTVFDDLGAPLMPADLFVVIAGFNNGDQVCVITGPNDIDQCSSLPPVLN